jgi:ribose transport system ATP-binding protein
MTAMTDGGAGAALEMTAIVKAFGGVRVLDGVDFQVRPGEVVALLGGNGAGKSTLMKILSGVYRKDAGEIAIAGSSASLGDPREANSLGICLLPQEISIMPDMTVAENICMGSLPRIRRFGLRVVDTAAIRSEAAERLRQLGFGGVDPDSMVGALSIAERRVVEIARALAQNARILIMDEPTAALTENETRKIFTIVRKLKEQSTAIIYISHTLKEVFEIADRIVVLRDGRIAGEFAPASSTQAEVVHAMLGAAGGDMFEGQRRAPGGRAPLLDVREATIPNQLENISFTVAKGEIVGVFGLIGSGIEILGRAIYGAAGPISSGEIRLDGRLSKFRSPADGMAAGIGFVAADRKREGIIGDLTVRGNLVVAFLGKFVEGIFVSRARETSETKHFVKLLGVRCQGPEQTMKTLSGGNQQKLCVARWLVGNIKLLLLEEPTRGVDVGARRDLYKELRKLSDEGLAILFFSSDVEEVAGLADRSLVLDHGAIAGVFPAGTPASVLMQATAPQSPARGLR